MAEISACNPVASWPSPMTPKKVSQGDRSCSNYFAYIQVVRFLKALLNLGEGQPNEED
jgi:hypothetical protein